MSSPSARAKKEYKCRGCSVYVTEKWNAFAGVRQDAFGFGDLLVICEPDIVLVQVTSGDNHLARKKKILSIPESFKWLNSGGKIVVMSFTKEKNGRYSMKEENILKENYGKKSNKRRSVSKD